MSLDLIPATIATLRLKPGDTLVIQPRAGEMLGPIPPDHLEYLKATIRQTVGDPNLKILFLDGRLDLSVVRREGKPE